MLSNFELRKLQMAELDILKVFIDICERYCFQYYIIGGTLLGAVRHRGFIPWDDDIDIAMPRNDYDKLLKVLHKELKEPYDFLHYTVSKTYREYTLKIINKNIICYEDKLDVEKSKTNIWIDILPLDGVPNNKIAYFAFKYIIYFLKAMLSFKNIDTIKNNKDRPFFEQILIRFAQLIPLKYIINRNYVMEAIDKTTKFCEYDKAMNIGTFMGAYRFREVVPKSYFTKSIKFTFEGLLLEAPGKTDEYLQHIYGDYMKLPNESKRIGHIVKIEYI